MSDIRKLAQGALRDLDRAAGKMADLSRHLDDLDAPTLAGAVRMRTAAVRDAANLMDTVANLTEGA
jgi:hypothetical protein